MKDIFMKIGAAIKRFAIAAFAKIKPAFASAKTFLAAVAWDAFAWVKRNRALLLFIIGMAAIAGSVALIYFAGYNKSSYDEGYTAMKYKPHLVWGIVLAAIGFASTIGAFVIKTTELNAALKALAATANAAPLVALAAVDEDGENVYRDVTEIPTSVFRIKIGEIGLIYLDEHKCIEERGAYEIVDDLKASVFSHINAATKYDKHGTSWNDFARRLAHNKNHDVPYGWQLGLYGNDVDVLVYDPYGNPANFSELVMILKDRGREAFESYELGFVGIRDLNEGKIFKLKEAA